MAKTIQFTARALCMAVVLATLWACGNQSSDTETTQTSTIDPLAADLETIMSWWPGDYHNDKQIAALVADGKPVWRADDTGKGGHIEVTSHYKVVDLPAFGEHVLYVEETKHGDESLIFRQRIYTLTVDPDMSAIRVKLWYFKDKEKYVGAWRDLSRLADLTPENMSPLKDECDLIVAREGARYHMPMQDKACVFGKNYFSYQVLLGEDSFWFRDKIVRVADDVVVSTAGDFSYHELDKVGL
ncbi:MAG: chromophore lyase CpcT/CpeT [Pseudomonadota bacterium]